MFRVYVKREYILLRGNGLPLSLSFKRVFAATLLRFFLREEREREKEGGGGGRGLSFLFFFFCVRVCVRVCVKHVVDDGIHVVLRSFRGESSCFGGGL